MQIKAQLATLVPLAKAGSLARKIFQIFSFYGVPLFAYKIVTLLFVINRHPKRREPSHASHAPHAR